MLFAYNTGRLIDARYLQNEMIVPVTMSGLQRKLYTSILERNVDFIASITKSAKAGGTNKRKKGVNNVLMELRKTLGHPYLVDQDIERTDVDRELMFQNFVRASTKLELLSKLLPKLKQKGHKVLIVRVPLFVRRDAHSPEFAANSSVSSSSISTSSKTFCRALASSTFAWTETRSSLNVRGASMPSRPPIPTTSASSFLLALVELASP